MKKFFRNLLIILLIAIFSVTLYGYIFYKNTIKKDPLQEKISETQSSPDFVKKDKLPENYINAVIAVEDHRYYSHGAIDPIGIARAIFTNAKNGELQEGGGSITQQVAKNLYFMEETKVVRRKIAEVFIAIDLQNKYSKDEILELYVNTIYFGNGYNGIKQACEGYLGKEPNEMNLPECTMMAGIPNAPSVYAPTANKELCKERQKKVISSMVQYGYITQEEADKIDQSFIDNIK